MAEEHDRTAGTGSSRRASGTSERHRVKRRKNLALMAALVGFALLVYLVSIVRMGG